MERIEQVLTYRGYSVTIASDQVYFTVYQGERIAGTIRRPERDQTSWQAYKTDGTPTRKYGFIGPRVALRSIAHG